MNFRNVSYGLLVLLFAQQHAFACKVTPVFTYSSTHTCGLPTIITAINTSTGSTAGISKFWWKINGALASDTIIGKDTAILYLIKPGSNTLRLFVKDTGKCIDSSTVNITVSSKAKSILDQNQNYTFTPKWMNCLQFISDPDSFRVSIQSADTLKQLRIIWGDGYIDTGLGNLLPNASVSHLYNILGIFKVKIVTRNGTCTDTVYGTVYNQRQPTAGIIGPTSGSNRGCVPHTLRIINNSYNISNNTNFHIDWGNGDSEDRPYTAYNDTMFHTYKKGVCAGIIKITATNVCGSSFSTWNPIDISDVDKALWTVNKSCNPNTSFVFNNVSSDRYCLIPDIKQYYWDFGDSTTTGWINSKSSQSHLYKKEGDYFVTLITKTACGNDTFKSKVQVSFNPQAGFIYNADRSCKPLNVTLTDTSHGRGYTRLWTVKEGSSTKTYTDSILNYSFTVGGIHTISLKVTNSCGISTLSKNFVVTDVPKAGFANISSHCAPVTVSFTNTSNSYFSNATYTWDFGDNTYSSLKNPASKTYTTPGNYTVKLFVSDSCGSDSFTQTFTVFGLPQADFTCDSQSCTFDSISIRNLSVNSNTFNWQMGDSSVFSTTDTTSFGYAYQNPGTYTIRLISGSGSGCMDTALKTIVINPGAKALFDIDKSFACSPATFSFTNNSIYGKDYTWYANGNLISDQKNISDTILYSDTTVIHLKLLVSSSSSCQADSIEKTFFTAKNPEPLISNRDSGCGTLGVQFKNQSQYYSSVLWDLGNGDSSEIADPFTSYKSALAKDTVYKAVLTAINWAGCIASDSTFIKVFPGPIADFTVDKDKACGPANLQFSSHSSTNNGSPFLSLSHHWDFGDGAQSTDTAPMHVFIPSGERDTFYSVKLSVSTVNGCTDTIGKIVQIYPKPKSAFTPDKTEGCAILDVHFTNHSVPNDTGNIGMMQFRWLPGNGISSDSVDLNSEFYGSPHGDTVYQVALIAYSEHMCTDTAFKTITVHPQPVALFSADKNDGCTPLKVKTINRSFSPDGLPLTHKWNFGNGYISNQFEDSTVYFNHGSGSVIDTIKYIAVSAYGCLDTALVSITVRPAPIADFTVKDPYICAPGLVELTDKSINASTYFWGTGNANLQGNAFEKIWLPGESLFDTTYILAHRVVSAYGCPSDTVYKQVTVYGRPRADFMFAKDSLCIGEKIDFVNQSLGAYQFKWDFGDNTYSTLINPKHNYKISSSYDTVFTVRLEVNSPRSCRDTFERTLYLVSRPGSSITLDNTAACSNVMIQMSNPSSVFKTSYWDLGDNSSYQFSDTVSHNYVNAGSTVFKPLVKLYRQRFNCMDTATAVLDIYPSPVSDMQVRQNNPCDAGYYQFINRSSNAGAVKWYLNGTYLNDLNSFTHLLPGSVYTDTVYNISLISENQYGCSDTISKM